MKSRITTPLCLALALILVLSTAASARVSREDSQTYALASGGRLSLENINGDIVIEAWDRDEVQVATRIEAKTQQSLDDVEVRIDSSSDSIHIETTYPQERRKRYDAAQVHYTIQMPRTAHIRELELVNGSLTLSGLTGDVSAELVNGKAEARDLAGNVELSTVNGSLEVSLTELDADQSIELESVNGSLTLKVPGHADADIEAETVHGRIRNDFGLEEEKGEYVGSSLRGALGRGGARVQLENVNGSINIQQN